MTTLPARPSEFEDPWWPKRDAWDAAVEAAIEAGDGRVIHTGPKTLAGVIATLDAAEAQGAYTIAYFPPGVYELGNGLSLSGRTAQIQGAGAGGWKDGKWTGTVFRALTQTGPVLNFTGYILPVSDLGHGFDFRVTHGNFGVVGSNVSDPTKTRSGVRLTKMSSATFQDIVVRNTGGPGWEHVESPGDAVYLCDIQRITVFTPVNAQVNDVPYFYFNESNGTRFHNLGCRSTTTTNDCGVSGAIVVTSNSVHPGYDMLFDGCWFEYLHIPTNGCVISLAVNKTHFRDFGWHDVGNLTGATNTAFYRLLPVPNVHDQGGNTISGHIPGYGLDPSTPSYGVDVQQSRNRITGIKGYYEKNVRIATGVTNTYVEFGGAESGATGVAVENNSTALSNVIHDNVNGVYYEGTHIRTNRVYYDGGGGPRITEVIDPTNGAIWLGNADARMQAVGPNIYLTAAEFHLRTPAFTPAPIYLRGGAGGLAIVTHTGNPNGAAIYASPGSLCLCTDGTMWRKATGVGTNDGWVALS